MERGTVKFRNNVLTLPYQKDERGEEKARESTKGPALLCAGVAVVLPSLRTGAFNGAANASFVARGVS